MNSLHIAWLMIRRTLGRKRGVITFLLLPCLVVTGTVFLFGNEQANRSIIPYVNEDQGVAGEWIISELGHKEEYLLKPMGTEAEVKEAIARQEGSTGLVIPAQYTENLLQGKQAPLELIEMRVSEESYTFRAAVDGMTVGLNQLASAVHAGTGAVSNIASDQQMNQEKLEQLLQETDKSAITGTAVDLQIYPKPGLNNVTGFTIMFMMGLLTSAVSVILEDRRQLTMARVYTAPVRSYEIAVGNFLGSFIIGIIQIVLVLGISRWVLHYDAGISFGVHFLILAAFMLVSMGIASTVAGLIRESKNANMLNSLIITPTCMIGGCFWPISIMPEYMQKIANFVPQKWTIQAVETISAGGSLSDIQLPLLILFGMAAILLAVGSVILRPSERGMDA
ncbi:ABC transporter [Paenibacillus sp. Root52]|uniref:ABC-2 type transport system permease protein n=1 Tax=Paenibacillus amylolyticus TaxID=1451 RepID=A0AAP5H7F5_PAEAM|nr:MULTISPECIES: ABC transporter permease [Paenibacillus]KQY92009.1 ABC transporter [Paenibacillus sp. Root52]MCG7379615.1 ABC transporter permease [Paenibacillus sp. ACRSA]MDR6726580.1 ABC-2 type transport system permease protein [Paenibacillus amylolyticus]